MPDVIYLDSEVVLAIHEEQLSIHGGGVGVRDVGLLESALARPRNRIVYNPDADLAVLAAAYAFGVARNHPFVDGNKRTAFVAMELCLVLNGPRLVAEDADALMAMLSLAAGDMEEDVFSGWIRKHLAPV